MTHFKVVCCLIILIAIGTGCASADKRFDQGWELEQKGQYEAAAMRYVQALEKDGSLEEARTRLREVGALAIAERFDEAEVLASRGDPVTASSHFRRADAVGARARLVGVRLPYPEWYDERRRVIFDDAFDVLVDAGAMAREQGRWEEGLAALHRAQDELEPTADQRHRALTEESTLLLNWSEYEYDMGHLRRAYAIADRVHELEWSPPEVTAQAVEYMDDYLAEGEVELIVLPVQVGSGPRRERAHRYKLATELETTLQQGYWRQPPAFVSLHSPLTVRDLITNGGVLDGDYRPATMALILRLADADYAAYLQLHSVQATEFDVRSRTQTVQTRSGESTTFVREDGQRRLQAEARVVLVDDFGNELTDVIVTGSGTAPFSRGKYDGNPAELNLGRNQVDLFDRFMLQAQEQAAFDALVMNLSDQMAGAVYRPALAQVP